MPRCPLQNNTPQPVFSSAHTHERSFRVLGLESASAGCKRCSRALHCPIGPQGFEFGCSSSAVGSGFCQHLMMPEPEVVKGHDIMKCLQIHVVRIPERGSSQIFVHPGNERLGVPAVSLEAYIYIYIYIGHCVANSAREPTFLSLQIDIYYLEDDRCHVANGKNNEQSRRPPLL
jgi:hypothetical protein